MCIPTIWSEPEWVEMFGSGNYTCTATPNLSDSAIQRVLEYLMMEDAEQTHQAPENPAISLLKSRAEELRRESSAISLLDARAKRDFAAGVLEQIIEDLSQ